MMDTTNPNPCTQGNWSRMEEPYTMEGVVRIETDEYELGEAREEAREEITLDEHGEGGQVQQQDIVMVEDDEVEVLPHTNPIDASHATFAAQQQSSRPTF
jgi:hypothetical protein